MEQDTESRAAVLRDLIGSKQKKQLKKDGDNSHDRLFDKVSSKGYYLPQRKKTDDDHTPRRYTSSSPYDAKVPVCVWS